MTRFQVKEYKLVCSSIYKCMNNDCGICRNNLNENSVSEEHLISSDVIIAVCGHGFHKICINDWIRNNNTCPICCKKWISK